MFNSYKLNTDTFEIEISEDKPLIAHLELKPNNYKIKRFQGEIEAFSSMEWENDEKESTSSTKQKNKKGVGQKIGEIKVCLTPGSKILEGSIEKFCIGEYGIIQY